MPSRGLDLIAECREGLRRELNIQKALAVCPTSLKYQWKTEIEKFTAAPVHVVEGLKTNRPEQYANSEAFFHIIRYNTMANDAEALQQFGADLLIIDEQTGQMYLKIPAESAAVVENANFPPGVSGLFIPPN